MEPFTTPCGFTIYAIPLKNHTIRFSVMFGGEVVGLDKLSDRLSLKGADMLADKIKQLTAELL